jgi:hypothetical protein
MPKSDVGFCVLLLLFVAAAPPKSPEVVGVDDAPAVRFGGLPKHSC